MRLYLQGQILPLHINLRPFRVQNVRTAKPRSQRKDVVANKNWPPRQSLSSIGFPIRSVVTHHYIRAV